MSSTIKRIAAATFASVMAFSFVAPAFVTEASAAPLPVATTLANDHSVQGVGVPVTDVRYRRYARRRGNGGAVVLGVLGLGLGIAALSAQRRQRYDSYYNDGYYGGGYYGGGYSNPGYSYYRQSAPVYSRQRYYGGYNQQQRYYRPDYGNPGSAPRPFSGGGNN